MTLVPAPILQAHVQSISFRRAVVADLPAIVAMLADDPLGSQRESVTAPPDGAYLRAFEAIDADANQLLAVATIGEEIVGTLHALLIEPSMDWCLRTLAPYCCDRNATNA